MKLRKYSLDELKKAVQNSFSYRQALLSLGVAAYGGNYAVIKKAISFYSLDISHFRGKSWNKGMKKSDPVNLEDYLENKKEIVSHKLRLKLLQQGYFEHRCNNCGLDLWLDKPIPLELHHINGNRKDNKLNNLMMLCPNCHTLTDNYRGKGKSQS